MIIYVTADGTWGSADEVILVDTDMLNDPHVDALIEDMNNGADAHELWLYLEDQ